VAFFGGRRPSCTAPAVYPLRRELPTFTRAMMCPRLIFFSFLGCAELLQPLSCSLCQAAPAVKYPSPAHPIFPAALFLIQKCRRLSIFMMFHAYAYFMAGNNLFPRKLKEIIAACFPTPFLPGRRVCQRGCDAQPSTFGMIRLTLSSKEAAGSGRPLLLV